MECEWIKVLYAFVRWVGWCIGGLTALTLIVCSYVILLLCFRWPWHATTARPQATTLATAKQPCSAHSVSTTNTNENCMALLSLYDYLETGATAANIVTRESMKQIGRTNAEFPRSVQPKKGINCLHAYTFIPVRMEA